MHTQEFLAILVLCKYIYDRILISTQTFQTKLGLVYLCVSRMQQNTTKKKSSIK